MSDGSKAWCVKTSGVIMEKDGYTLTGCPGGLYFEFFREGRPSVPIFTTEMIAVCRILSFIKRVFRVRVILRRGA